MSLIEEALRRAQEAGRIPESREPPPPSPQPGQPPTPVASLRESPLTTAVRPSRSWFEVALIGGGFVLVIGLVVWEFWISFGPGISTATRPVTTAPRTDSQVVQASFRPASRKSLLPPHLELTGIVEGPGEPLAIINGNIMRVGDTVDEATLLEVRGDSARVHWRDRELVLRLTR